MRIHSRQSGITLIETIVYLGLYALVVAGALSGVYALLESSARNETSAMLGEEGDFVIGKIQWLLAGSSAVASSLGTTSYLMLENTSIGDVTIDSSRGTIRIAVGNGAPETLNNSEASIGNLTFVNTAQSAAPASVFASFTISATTSDGRSISRDVSRLVYLRKSI